MKKYIIAVLILSPCLLRAQQVISAKGLPKSTPDKTTAQPKVPPPHSSNEGPLWAYYVKNNPTFKPQLSNTTSAMEVGYAFTVSKKGMVYGFSVYAPVANATYTVTLWDSATQQPIKQKKVTILTKDNFQTINFDNEAVEIQANRTYVVSMNTAINGSTQYYPYYILKKDNPAEKFLPYTYKHITLKEGRYCFGKNANTPVYPANTDYYTSKQDVVLGLVDVNYYPTEF
ncbi:MAG: DUF4082 domain-containing protein [Bacteroidetes bacterium]|nr:DUF4082 domain-containing protein [Bacteroidota bacterium]